MKESFTHHFRKNILFPVLLTISVVWNVNATAPGFAKGADISWLPQMEASGYKFYNASGTQEDCFQILKDLGINSIRLRTWVHPSTDKTNGHCSKSETVAMALRAQQYGMRIMIDFHYSDSWADPSKQNKPAAWAGCTFSQLLDSVYNYTADVMTALKTAGIYPEWVQVGNEITGGMLWPDGSNSSSWTNLVQLINKGYDAVKAVSPDSKVILHVDQGNNNSRFVWWFGNATTNGAKFDVIGMSYYPYWLNQDYTLSINNLGANLLDMVSRYNKDVIVAEVGGLDTNAQNTYDMLTAVIAKVKAVPNSRGLGVFYWEPEGARSWSGYALSAWGSDGKPTIAMNAFNDLTALNETKATADFYIYNRDSGTIQLPVTCSRIEIISLNGKVVKTAGSTDIISTGNLEKGIYLIRAVFKNNEGDKVFKLNIS